MTRFALEVWGDYACFTRPETKVERLSYPVITPSAARAIFDAIYLRFEGDSSHQPVFRWQIQRIEILNPIEFIGFSRNEVKGKMSTRRIETPLLADASGKGSETSGRTQRQSMILRDVRYRLFAEPILYEPNPLLELQISKMFIRRATRGQCFHQPCLGCREFVAFFELVEPIFGKTAPINQDIGWMIYDVFDLSKPGSSFSLPSISIFKASIHDGVVKVPPFDSEAVRKLGIRVI